MNAQTELLLNAMNPLTRMEWERNKPHPPSFSFVAWIGGEGETGLHSCERCGVIVPDYNRETHTDWHEETSLRHWTISFLLNRIKEANDLHG